MRGNTTGTSFVGVTDATVELPVHEYRDFFPSSVVLLLVGGFTNCVFALGRGGRTEMLQCAPNLAYVCVVTSWFELLLANLSRTSRALR